MSDDYTFLQLRNRLVIEGTLVATTALRVGAGRESSVVGNDLPVLRDAAGRPFIPGASLKGAFRARVEALLRAIAADPNDLVPDLDALEERTKSLRRDKQQRRWSDQQFDTAIWHTARPADLLFGSPEIAGRLFFKDARVTEKSWFDRFEVRNGVVLNRDTETVEQGLLYDFEVVPAGTEFDFALTLENAAPWQRGLVLLALKPWEHGDVQIGGFRSRGLGYVRLDITRRQFTEVKGVKDIIELLEGAQAEHNITAEHEQQWKDKLQAELERYAKAA